MNAIGLPGSASLERFRRDLGLAALLHDLGKCASDFQLMIRKKLQTPQLLRHEAVSFWVATRPEFENWILNNGWTQSQFDQILWAVAGHHRKFPPNEFQSDREFLVFLGHTQIQELLRVGAQRLCLSQPPRLQNEALPFIPRHKNVHRHFKNLREQHDSRFAELSAVEKRYAAVLKAAMIGADVAGSIRDKDNQPITQWMENAFQNTPAPEILEDLVEKRLGGKPPRVFQTEVCTLPHRITLVRAGCGSGKTIAAYLWAARKHPGKRIYVCYPTMGTATEGYRDYLRDADLDAKLVHGLAHIDMKILSVPEDESDMPSEETEQHPTVADTSALDLWSTPVVSCTVDTVLGLLHNHRRGIQAWPSIANSVIVFDEIHSYDNGLFQSLRRFIRELPGIPCLLMTASLPAAGLQALKEDLASTGETLGELDGPKELEGYLRYQHLPAHDPWHALEQAKNEGKKVLWVVNTVNAALDLADTAAERGFEPILYHSRFRYLDRLEKHKKVIDRFKESGHVLAISTQVAEMSLDLSANLLITQVAPIPALIQRLGRLNRRAHSNDPWPFIVTEPSTHLPYEEGDLGEARQWLEKLGNRPLSQADLINAWNSDITTNHHQELGQIWLDGGFETEPRSLRDASPSIFVIRPEDVEAIKAKEVRIEAVRIPMPVPRRESGWKQDWEEIGFCKVPPHGVLQYDAQKGARWAS